MKRTWLVIAAVLLFFQTSAIESSRAQDPVGQPALEVRLLSEGELDILLGPVALYPDPLLAALLPASTKPTDIVLASRYLNQGGDADQIDSQAWSEDVKALARYPEVLKWMDENLEWTTAVGNAFLTQPDGVMETIQRLRAIAESLGNLKSTPEQIVESEGGEIDILPADPDVVYVPVYQPIVVYTRPASPAVSPITFSPRQRVGAWLNRDWDWPRRSIIVWNKQQFRPRFWWSQPRVTRCATIATSKPWAPQARPGQPLCKFWNTRREAANAAALKPQGASTHHVHSTQASSVSTPRH